MQHALRKASASVIRRIPLPGRWRLVPLIAGRTQEPTTLVASIPNVGLMELDISSTLEREIFVTGTHGDERRIAEKIRAYLDRPGAVFVDVGANVGYHTIAAGRRLAGHGGAVYAFEPIRANHDRLVGNVRMNDLANVYVEHAGLSDREETVEVRRTTRGTSNASLASEGDVREWVKLIRFDEWMRNHPLQRIDVVKMDIEGAELRALRGMTQAIARFRPVLVVEINPMWTRRMGTSTNELIAQLHDMGYTLYECSESCGEPLTSVDPQGSVEVNAICLPA